MMANLHVGVGWGRGRGCTHGLWCDLVAAESTFFHFWQVLGKEDIAALKSRLLRIKKHVDEIPATASSATPSSSPSLVPDSSSSAAPETIISASAEAKTLQLSVARAKELAAKAQKRKEAAAQHELTESRAQDR